MNKTALNKKSLEELVSIAVKQESMVKEIRGYSSGMDAKKLALLGKDVLIDCILKTNKNYKLNMDFS